MKSLDKPEEVQGVNEAFKSVTFLRRDNWQSLDCVASWNAHDDALEKVDNAVVRWDVNVSEVNRYPRCCDDLRIKESLLMK